VDITKDKTLLLADFGVSDEVATKTVETLNKITRKEVKGYGTPAYMSPEIFKIVAGL
jgi:hypothetical protein